MFRTKDEFYQRMKELVIPIMIQSFMLALVSATDALMLGLVDQTSLSAVSLGGQVQFILNMFVIGMTMGLGIMAAQYWGKGDCNAIERVVMIAMRFNVIVGSIFTLAAAFAPRVLIALFTNDSELIVSGALYLRAVSLSYILCGVSQIYLALLKNIGQAVVSTKISSAAVILNIIGNGILIFGLFGAPKLGIAGAAYATVMARAFEVIAAVVVVAKTGPVKVRWSRMFAKEPELSKDFWKYSTPALGAGLVWGLAYSSYSVIMGHMGSDAVAANSITGIAKSLVSCLIRGVGGGAGIMIGNVLGAGELEKAKAYGRRLVRLSIAVGVLTGGFLVLISPLIVQIAPLSETASEYLQYMLLFCGINVVFQAVNITVLDGIFCAGGDSKFDMIGNIFAMWCFSVPVGFLAAFWLKLPPIAVYCIINMDEIVKIPAVYLRYVKYIWVRNITKSFSVSENTLKMMESSMENYKKGVVSEAVDLSEFAEDNALCNRK